MKFGQVRIREKLFLKNYAENEAERLAQDFFLFFEKALS